MDAPLPEWLEDREAELWAPIITLGRMVAPSRMTEIEHVARTLSGAKAEDDDSIGIRALADLRTVLDGADFMPTQQIIDALVAIEDAPWSEYRAGRTLTPRGLAELLKPFGIEPKQSRHEGKAGVRGYHRQAFLDDWERYLLPISTSDPLQVLQPVQDKGQRAIDDPLQTPLVADAEIAGNASGTRLVADVADERPEEGGNGIDHRRAWVLEAGRARDFRRLDIQRGEAVAAGQAAWIRFAARATPDQLFRATSALMAPGDVGTL
jgi:Protein of unknown function (DUF3631)